VDLIKKLRKWLPNQTEIQQYRYIHIFGDFLKQPELWTFNRATTPKGIAIGVFCAFLPMPFEMIAAIFIACMIGGNLPFAVAGVWISNPFTWIPLYTPCYLLGSKILNIDPIPLDQITILALGLHYVALWLGCLIIGTVASLITHFTISYLWISHVKQRWHNRKQKRLLQAKQKVKNELRASK